MIIGVDPGLSGAIALIAEHGDLVEVHDMPVVDGLVSSALLANLIRGRGVDVAVVEQVSARPGQGVSSMFKFGRSLGVVEGVLSTLGVPVVYVTPGKWKKAMGLSSDKELSRRRAIDRWPDRAASFARKKDDGRAEAALLAEYHRTKGGSNG